MGSQWVLKDRPQGESKLMLPLILNRPQMTSCLSECYWGCKGYPFASTSVHWFLWSTLPDFGPVWDLSERGVGYEETPVEVTWRGGVVLRKDRDW